MNGPHGFRSSYFTAQCSASTTRHECPFPLSTASIHGLGSLPSFRKGWSLTRMHEMNPSSYIQGCMALAFPSAPLPLCHVVPILCTVCYVLRGVYRTAYQSQLKTNTQEYGTTLQYSTIPCIQSFSLDANDRKTSFTELQ